MFVGSDAGVERAAMLYGQMNSTKQNGMALEAYLRDVLGRIAEHPVNGVTGLLPWNLAKQAEPIVS